MSRHEKNWGDPKHFHMFSDERISLNIEVRKHPKLLEVLAQHPQDEFEILLAQIASYCEVVLNGEYLPSDLDNICKACYNKLVFKRTGFSIAREQKKDTDTNSTIN